MILLLLYNIHNWSIINKAGAKSCTPVMSYLHPCEMVLRDEISCLETFLTEIEEKISPLGVLTPDSEIDHVCYRTESIKEYRDIIASLVDTQSMGTVIADSMIGGRPITIIRLTEPIKFKYWNISLIELPSPKAGSFYATGWEHAEIVIGDSCVDCVDNKTFLESFVSKHNGLAFDTRAIDKEVNADVSLKVSERISVKFHCKPLYEVIDYEVSHGLVSPVPDSYWLNNNNNYN